MLHKIVFCSWFRSIQLKIYPIQTYTFQISHPIQTLIYRISNLQRPVSNFQLPTSTSTKNPPNYPPDVIFRNSPSFFTLAQKAYFWGSKS